MEERTNWLTRHWKPLLAVIVSIHVALVAWNGAIHSPTWDEVGHLVAGIDHWERGSFELYKVNPPLVRMVAAVPAIVIGHRPLAYLKSADFPGRPEWSTGGQFLRDHKQQSFMYFKLARWACLPFSVLAAVILFVWARDAFGTTAGLLAAALWCFDPNVLGNAATITPDIGAASLGVLAAYSFRGWLREPSWRRALVTGLCTGIAELTRTTWLLLFGIWPLIWILSCTFNQRIRNRWRLDDVGQLAVILIVAVYVINLGYAFERSCEPLGAFQFVSASLRGAADSSVDTIPAGNRFKDTWLGALPVPFPANYALGVDFQKREFEIGYPAFLMGELRQPGWWYYYFCALLWKVPLGYWMIFLVATAAAWRFRNKTVCSSGTRESSLACPMDALNSHEFRYSGANHLCEQLLIVLVPVVVLAVVSSQTGINNHLRYVLPVFPFGVLWASQAARFVDSRSAFSSTCVGVGLAWGITSSLCVFPHSLSYFNELTGGPTGAHAFLGCSPPDTSLECGQDLLLLKEWLDEHPQVALRGIAYSGMPQARQALGINCGRPAPGRPPSHPGMREIEGNDWGPQPGWYAVSVKEVHCPGGALHYFASFKPAARIGYSLLLYNIDSDEAQAFHRRQIAPTTAR
jgi:hypothetical protein